MPAFGRTTATGSGNPYGSIPNLPTSGALQGNMSQILNQAIPGFSGLTQSASSIIGDAMNGRVPQDVQDLIQNNAAQQAVSGGMPGSSRVNGTVFGNKTLRDLGLTSLQRQDTGVKDLIGLLQGVSGTAAPTFGQAQEQEDARAQYAAAPDPAAAASEQERLYNKYANPASGMGGAGGGAIGGGRPWWQNSTNGSQYGKLIAPNTYLAERMF